MPRSSKSALTQVDGEPRRLTMANEDYLESIYRIAVESGSSDGIRSVDVAEQLNVSKASVNKALSTLKDAGLVEQGVCPPRLALSPYAQALSRA